MSDYTQEKCPLGHFSFTKTAGAWKTFTEQETAAIRKSTAKFTTTEVDGKYARWKCTEEMAAEQETAAIRKSTAKFTTTEVDGNFARWKCTEEMAAELETAENKSNDQNI